MAQVKGGREGSRTASQLRKRTGLPDAKSIPGGADVMCCKLNSTSRCPTQGMRMGAST
jgi:hypothetical protein